MYAGLQIIICISNSIWITTFSSTSPITNYSLLIKYKACTLKNKGNQLNQLKCKKLNYPINIFCTYVKPNIIIKRG